MIVITDNKFVRSDAGARIVRKSNPQGEPFAEAWLLAGETAGDFAEVEDTPAEPYTEEQYKAKVVELVRARYDQDDENGFLRQRDSKPDEFKAYDAYVEECKARAKELLTARSEAATEDVTGDVQSDVPSGEEGE